MKPIDWKSYIGLMIFATIGLVVFSLLLDTFYPYKGANVRIGRAQAIEVAEDFMDERGYDLYGFKRSTVMQYDDEAFIYLQKKFGFKVAQDIAEAHVDVLVNGTYIQAAIKVNHPKVRCDLPVPLVRILRPDCRTDKCQAKNNNTNPFHDSGSPI